MAKRRILVLALGGTIAMTRNASGGIAPSLTGEDLVAAVPGLAEIGEIEAESPFQLPGASLTLEDLGKVARLIEARNADGVVVVQGTDTIEETAFVLDCLLSPEHVVVVTGAMRGPEAPGADGPANLTASVTVAASEAARGLGALVVLNDEVHAARYVRKGHTGLPSAFTSGAHGPVGHVIEGAFRCAMRPVGTEAVHLPPCDQVPPVALVQIGIGDDGRLINALPELGYRGAVISAMGAGHVPGILSEALESLASCMPVILCSRVAEGPVFTRTYGFAGSERDLLGRGLINGGTLGPLKARLLLQLLLGANHEKKAISRVVLKAGGSEEED